MSRKCLPEVGIELGSPDWKAGTLSTELLNHWILELCKVEYTRLVPISECYKKIFEDFPASVWILEGTSCSGQKATNTLQRLSDLGWIWTLTSMVEIRHSINLAICSLWKSCKYSCTLSWSSSVYISKKMYNLAEDWTLIYSLGVLHSINWAIVSHWYLTI